jgi:UDP-N-acetylmuramyl pentapeptide phosphotransferase/UDP-N-acetylglucosamine-1-phosphate transferase
MTVAEFVPVCAGVVLVSFFVDTSALVPLVAVALGGAIVGFAPFNRPVAKLFLGDVGSLPLGLMLFWLLAGLAGRGHLAAAILLPLYYLMDATITLARRLAKGEMIFQAHRSHFYQRATDLGFSVSEIVTHVFAVNIGLAALAVLSVALPSWPVQAGAVVIGVFMVAGLLLHWSRSRH